MKITQLAGQVAITKRRSARCPATVQTRLYDGRAVRPRAGSSLIRWPTEQELQQVSRKLSQVRRRGVRQEMAGDYFNSGDFAFRINEIIRATEELFRKSRSL